MRPPSQDAGLPWHSFQVSISSASLCTPLISTAPLPPPPSQVLITTYELVLKDADMLRARPWSYLIVDEAHRLKNSESALYQELAGWPFRNKLLVTGTPIQVWPQGPGVGARWSLVSP